MNTNRSFSLILASALLLLIACGAFALIQLRTIERRTQEVLAELRLIYPGDLGNRRLDVRVFVIRNQLSQTDHPIVFIGDSITEAARLPSSICDRPVVNAGIGGAAVSSYADVAKDVIRSLDASLIVIALGTNDAGAKLPADFRERYRDLVHTVREHAPKIVLAGVPPIEDGTLRPFFDVDTATKINAIIGEVARDEGLDFADIRSAIRMHPATVDGVHLWSSSYLPWLTKIRDAINHALSCSSGQ